MRQHDLDTTIGSHKLVPIGFEGCEGFQGLSSSVVAPFVEMCCTRVPVEISDVVRHDS